METRAAKRKRSRNHQGQKDGAGKKPRPDEGPAVAAGAAPAATYWTRARARQPFPHADAAEAARDAEGGAAAPNPNSDADDGTTVLDGAQPSHDEGVRRRNSDISFGERTVLPFELWRMFEGVEAAGVARARSQLIWDDHPDRGADATALESGEISKAPSEVPEAEEEVEEEAMEFDD